MTRIGLCLGAGGLMGQACHAGVVAALQLDLGWDARDADHVVGTSAGAVTGALLRLDTSPFDLAGWILGHPWRPDQTGLEGFDAIRGELPPLTARLLMRPWRPPALGTWFPTRGRPRAVRPMAVLSSMLPPGRTALEGLLARHMDPAWGHQWPDRLSICATRRKDGRRVVFDRSATAAVPLPTAVAASTSIPGYFRPVTIDGDDFLDGAVHSPTNADVLASAELDVVLVVSPMSGGAGPIDMALRRFARRRLRSEVRHLERQGTRVVVFEPGLTTARAMGVNPMAAEGVDRVLRAAFFEAGALTARPEIRRLLLSPTASTH